jgi:hypothetical protein
MRENQNGTNKIVYALTERADKTYWTKVGVAFACRDGSLTVQLDALPVSGKLQIRSERQADEGDPERR